jgi:hypothetical protein
LEGLDFFSACHINDVRMSACLPLVCGKCNIFLMDVHQPLAWFGEDRLVLKDCTPYGLHRRVIARKLGNGEIDVEVWLRATQADSAGRPVYGWLVYGEDLFSYLWLVWKE